MQTWRISWVTLAISFLVASCAFQPQTDPAPDQRSTASAVTSGLLKYEGAYIRQSPVVRIMYWRTVNGMAVADATKAIAGPTVSATVSSAHYDWLKAEYTTPAGLSPTGVSLVPNRGWLASQFETASGLANIINDADIRNQMRQELNNGNLGPHTGNTSTDNQLMVLVVVPAGVSVRGLSSNASNSDVPYHDNTFGSDSIAYMVVRDDAGFVANASASIASAALNPDADFNFRAWQSGFLSVPFREVGCFNTGIGSTVPVFDAASGTTVFLAPEYSNAQATCIGPPIQITDAAAHPVQPSQNQSVPANGAPGPYTFYATNRSAVSVSLSSNAACAFTPSPLAAGGTGRVDCSAPQSVTLSASFGATVYQTSMLLDVSCPRGYEFDGSTCAPIIPTCGCPCGCNAAGHCIRCPICDPKLGCDP